MKKEFRYIKWIDSKNPTSVKVVSDTIIEKRENELPIICKLNFDYNAKEGQELLKLLYGIIPEYVTRYGSNKDVFKYDPETNVLSKHYETFNKKTNEFQKYDISFTLTEKLKEELIDFIVEKDNEYNQYLLDKVVNENEEDLRKSIETLQNKLKSLESKNVPSSNNKEVKTFIKPEPIKELKNFNEFVENGKVNRMKLVEYLDRGDGFKFTKWLLQSNKYSGNIETVKYSLMSEPIEKLENWRKEYLKI